MNTLFLPSLESVGEGQSPAAAPRERMNGKRVVTVAARSVLNFKSAFEHKKLCDGPTFSTGSACVYSCAFCYVPAIMRKNPHGIDPKLRHEEIVVRRENPIEVLRRQLTRPDGSPRVHGPHEAGRVVFYNADLQSGTKIGRRGLRL